MNRRGLLRRFGLLLLLGAYVVACALLFVYASVVPYAQLTLYAGLDASGRTDAYFDLKSPHLRLSTPALVQVCRDLMGKDSKLVEGAAKSEAGPALSLKNLKTCEPSLLMRGDSVDLALLGRQHAYLWAATKEDIYRESALLFISRSNTASPRRSDAGAINAQSMNYLDR